MTATFDRAPLGPTRLAGACYVAIILLGLFGELVARAGVVVGDPAATARAIESAPTLWRLGIAGDLLMHVLDIPVLVVLHLLLRPINGRLAFVATGLNLVQTAVLVANKLTLLVPVYLLAREPYLSAFNAQQLEVLSYVAIKAHGYGFGVGLIFFGAACVIRGYLMVQADYFARWVGVLLMGAGVSYGVNSLTLLFSPALARDFSPVILLPALLGEVSLAAWLLVKGVRLPQWLAHTQPSLPR